MTLLNYILKRAVYMLAVLFFVAVLNFILFEYIPMQVFNLGPQFFVPCKGIQCNNSQIYTHVINEFGLNLPWPIRFEKYITNIFTGQFGVCISTACGNRPVWSILAQYAPNSILILSVSTIIAIFLGTFLGVISASKRGKFIDIASLSTGIFAFSVPSFWIGLLLIYFLAVRVNWFPLSLGNALINAGPPGTIGYIEAYLWAAALPILVLTMISYGFYLLIMRNTMYDILTEDYIMMARAKGLSERKVLYKHAFRNALLPVVTGIALAFGGILGGAIITETIFNFAGIGYATLIFIFANDYPVLQGAFFLIALMTVVANFMADLAYGFLDPRITY
jgi:ABC-type dipeptide/oligopeptide/nickel transport system permease component